MSKERYNQIIDEVYNKYTTKYMGYDDVPSKELFLFEIKNNPEFSEKWGLKIGERELNEKDRYELVRVNGLCPKYSFEIENGKPVPNKLSQSEWYDKYNIPTKIITITYNNETIESYE